MCECACARATAHNLAWLANRRSRVQWQKCVIFRQISRLLRRGTEGCADANNVGTRRELPTDFHASGPSASYNPPTPLTVALTPGTRLGAYEILTLIGSGGMGEVYRAKDTKLGRDVALKILPVSFTNDPERVARFRREAQVLASLNHPHVAQIYGLDEANGTQFLVLELVDGESLDCRIARGRIPVDEALTIARQIAEALEAAHDKGIIHRDLKPANVALTKDGRVKVLDFGLARAVEKGEVQKQCGEWS